MPVKLTVAGSIPHVADWHRAALAAAAPTATVSVTTPASSHGRAGHGAELGPLCSQGLNGGVQGLARQITRRSDPGR